MGAPAMEPDENGGKCDEQHARERRRMECRRDAFLGRKKPKEENPHQEQEHVREPRQEPDDHTDAEDAQQERRVGQLQYVRGAHGRDQAQNACG